MAQERPLAERAHGTEPLCLHLRSKNICVAGELDASLVHEGGGHCWCNLTQYIFGPKQVLVDKDLCNSSRECFVPAPR